MNTYFQAGPAPIRVQAWRPKAFSATPYMAQAPVVPVEPTPPTPKAPLDVPLVLLVVTGAGALVGYLSTIAMGAFDKRFEVTGMKKVAGVVGGALGAFVGTGLTLLLKESSP